MCVLLKVGRVDCRTMMTECNNLHIHKFPAFVVFKPDFGHEIHHGRYHQLCVVYVVDVAVNADMSVKVDILAA